MDLTDAVVRIIVSGVQFTAAMILSLSLFRFPIRQYWHIAMLIGFIMSGISYYLRFVVFLEDFVIISLISVEIILVMLLLSIPLLYAAVVSIIGAIISACIEIAILQLALKLDWITVPLTNLQNGISLLIASLIMILLTLLLQRRKYGFLFIRNWLETKKALKGYNFILSALLLVSVTIVQVMLIQYNRLLINTFLIIILTILLLIILVFAYRHNKKLIRERYKRLDKR